MDACNLSGLGIVYMGKAGQRGTEMKEMKKIVWAILTVVLLLFSSALPSYAGGGSWGGRGAGGSAWVGNGWRGGAWGGRGWWGGGRGSGVVFGTNIIVGPGFWGPGWYGPAYPYYPYPYYAAPPVVIQQEPQVYIQQPEAQPQQPNYWYYCQNPQGYYPHVQQCPGGWMTVVPPTTAPPR